MTIREGTQADYPAIAALMCFTHSIPATEESMVQMDARRNPAAALARYVAEFDGKVVGYSKSERRMADRPRRFALAVAVALAHRNKGIGTDLYRRAEDAAIKEDPEELWVQTSEGDLQSETFCEHRGYERNFFLGESSLDLATFDPALLEFAVQAAEGSDIRFTAYADFDDSEENRRKLYELHMAVEKDVPNVGQDNVLSFEEWTKRVILSPWYDSAGQFIALEGDRWIGICAVGRFSPEIYLNTITGVLEEYRRRNLGLALKLKGIEFAKSKGAQEIRTQNHSTNEPILAINKKLGYQSLPGWTFWHRHLTTTLPSPQDLNTVSQSPNPSRT